MQSNRQFNVISLIVLLLAFTLHTHAQNNSVTWSSFNSAFAEIKASNTVMRSVIGQNFVGTTTFNNTQVTSGFLADTLLRSILVNVQNQEQSPSHFDLWQNYPNPFNPSTIIHFELSEESHVILKVYNILGQEVMKLLEERKPSGGYDVRLDGSMLSSGVYFYRLFAGEPSDHSGRALVATKKFVLVK